MTKVPCIVAYTDGPHGVFSPDHHAGEGYVFLAGGVGIGPIMSTLRTFASQLSLTVIIVVADPSDDWAGERGYIDAAKLRRYLRANHQTLQYCTPENESTPSASTSSRKQNPRATPMHPVGRAGRHGTRAELTQAANQQHPLAVRSARCACSELSVPPTEARNSSRSMRRPPSQVPVTWTVSINAAGSTVHGSALSSTKSASLPGAIDHEGTSAADPRL